jgi:hypothetical protein
VLAVVTGVAGALLAVLFPVAPGLARWESRTDERLARTLLGPGSREELAEGRSNAGIVAVLKVSPSAVEKYVTNIFLKLDRPAASSDHRRVLAVLKYLGT